MLTRSQYHGYAAAPTGKFNDLSGKGTPGCEGNLMELTFTLSLVAQIAVLVTSVVAIATQNPMPPPLLLVLWMETTVQLIELAWYGTVGAMYWRGKWSISTGYRYIDWMLTTPIMLFSIFFFGTWEADKCTTLDQLVEGSRGGAIAAILLCDWAMLFIGAAYENQWPKTTGFLDGIPKNYLGFNLGNGVGLWYGWIFFIGAFLPIIVASVADGWEVGQGGFLTLWISVVAWALYGVVALAGRWNPPWRDEKKWYWLSPMGMNTAYNLLDIVSKNVMGLVISALVLNDGYDKSCIHPPSAPPASA